MKLNSKRVDLKYQPGEELFTFPDETGLPFIFDVDKELTSDPAAMDIVGKMLDETKSFAEKAKEILFGIVLVVLGVWAFALTL